MKDIKIDIGNNTATFSTPFVQFGIRNMGIRISTVGVKLRTIYGAPREVRRKKKIDR